MRRSVLLPQEFMTPEKVPNDAAAEFDFGYLRISIPVQGRSNIERREHGSDEEVHRPERELFARTDPKDHGYYYPPFVGVWTLVSLTSSQIRTLYPRD